MTFTEVKKIETACLNREIFHQKNKYCIQEEKLSKTVSKLHKVNSNFRYVQNYVSCIKYEAARDEQVHDLRRNNKLGRLKTSITSNSVIMNKIKVHNLTDTPIPGEVIELLELGGTRGVGS